jgi:hypothetical protein
VFKSSGNTLYFTCTTQEQGKKTNAGSKPRLATILVILVSLKCGAKHKIVECLDWHRFRLLLYECCIPITSKHPKGTEVRGLMLGHVDILAPARISFRETLYPFTLSNALSYYRKVLFDATRSNINWFVISLHPLFLPLNTIIGSLCEYAEFCISTLSQPVGLVPLF